MNGLDIDVIRTALDWQSRGQRVVMGTVVRTWGSAPRPPGSLMVIRDDGQVAGSASDGCIEDDLIGRLARGELALRRPETTTLGETTEEARRCGLPCGGTVQLVLEPLSPASQPRELLAAMEGHQRVQGRLDMATGVARLTPPEIAMSIVAEMTAIRRGMDLSGPLSNWAGSKTVCLTC